MEAPQRNVSLCQSRQNQYKNYELKSVKLDEEIYHYKTSIELKTFEVQKFADTVDKPMNIFMSGTQRSRISESPTKEGPPNLRATLSPVKQENAELSTRKPYCHLI